MFTLTIRAKSRMAHPRPSRDELLAPGKIEAARKLAPSIDFYQSQAESLPLVHSSVDFAFSAVSLHHWQNAAAGVCEVPTSSL
jgi:ubiquinone/menaquinone biosynthesis C-methylase UbiE